MIKVNKKFCILHMMFIHVFNNEKIKLVINMKFKNILKTLREENGLTQEDVANILKIDRTTYNRYETDYNILSIKYLNDLANYFNVSFDYLFNFTNIKNYKKSNKSLDRTTFANRLKTFRKENKITQEKLATSLNTNKSVLCNYEKERYMISTMYLYIICKEYHISADYLLGKIDEPKYLI